MKDSPDGKFRLRRRGCVRGEIFGIILLVIRTIVTTLAGYALLGVSLIPVANAAGETPWFSEDVLTFAENGSNRWRFSPNDAKPDGDYIAFTASEYGQAPALYSPVALSAPVSSMRLDYTAIFSAPGSMDADAAGSVFAVQIVPDGDSAQALAVYDPATGWVKTSFAAATGREYELRIEFSYSGGARQLKYSCRQKGSAAYTEVAAYTLPAKYQFPKEFEFAGDGFVSSFKSIVGDSLGANTAQVSGSEDWSAIDWDGTWIDGGSAVITLTGDTVLDFTGAAQLPVSIEFVSGGSGEKTLQIVDPDGVLGGIPLSFGEGVVLTCADVTWTGGESGDWDVAANWSPNVVPTKGSRVQFENDAAVRVPAGAGAGGIEVKNGVTVEFLGLAPKTGFYAGNGTVKFGFSLSDAELAAFTDPQWKGTLWFDRVYDLYEMPIDRMGTADSVIRFSDSIGYFRKGTYDVPSALEMYEGEEGMVSLDIVKVYGGDTVTLGALTGQGFLTVSAEEDASTETSFVVDDVSGFSGSFLMNHGDILLEDDDQYLIPEGRHWTTLDTGFISVPGGTSLHDFGLIGGKVVGTGRVCYTGVLGPEKIEDAAQFTSTDWAGTVSIEDAVFNGPSLGSGANAGSRLTINGATGDLAGQIIGCPVTLSGSGLTVTGSRADDTVVFSKLLGDGPFTLAADAGDRSRYEVFRLDSVENYGGRLTVEDAAKSFHIGAADPVGAGAIAYAGGAVVPANLEWSAQRTGFGEDLIVTNGVPGDVLEYVPKAGVGNYETVTIRFRTPGIENRAHYALVYDDWNHSLAFVAKAAAPELDVDAVNVEYGTDLTNAVITLTVTNYWEGVDYNGGTYARVVVRDANGDPYKVMSADIHGNGVITIGTVDLPGDIGRSFTYEVSIETKRSEFDTEEDVYDYSDVRANAHPETSGWIYENAETYQLPAGDPAKTGSWSSAEPGAIAVEDDRLRIFCESEANPFVSFEAADEAREDVVEFGVDFSLLGGDTSAKDIPDALGMIRIDEEEEDASGNARYQVFAFDPEAGAMVKVYGVALTDDEEAAHHLRTLFNYSEGTVAYQLDGAMLTNQQGRSVFRLTAAMMEAANRVRSVGFSGACMLDLLTGDQLSRDLAETVSADGSVTNRYAKVGDAVAAAGEGDGPIRLLWDSSWCPSSNDVGRTIGFEYNGHVLYVDPSVTNELHAQGYDVVDNEDGSYTIGVVWYTLTLASNDTPYGGDTKTKTQQYSVTNRTFNLRTLADCAISRAGFDFVAWNRERDGSGATNWTDGAVIDMSEFGLGDAEIYAQWQVSVRTVRIEPSDPSVYIELVTTNGVEHTGVRYFRPTASGEGFRQAEVPVFYGCSNLVIRYSTDIGKRLSFDYLKAGGSAFEDRTVYYAEEPTNLVADANGEYKALSSVASWAASHFVPQASAIASPWAKSSSKLQTNRLIDERSEVVITDFKVTDAGCSFRVRVDGEFVEDAAALQGMVKSLDPETCEWNDAVLGTSGEEGTVEVVADRPGAIIKIVIPKN